LQQLVNNKKFYIQNRIEKREYPAFFLKKTILFLVKTEFYPKPSKAYLLEA
jgi:hypothetical protein